MKVDYTINNQTEISGALVGGETELEIAFYAKGLLKDMPSTFIIPQSIRDEYNKSTKFFLNVDYVKQPPEWVIDKGERPLQPRKDKIKRMSQGFLIGFFSFCLKHSFTKAQNILLKAA